MELGEIHLKSFELMFLLIKLLIYEEFDGQACVYELPF